MTAARITAAHPVLAARDIDETAAFYEKLGFAMTVRHDDYLILQRDGCEVHFWRCEDRAIAGATSCYIRSADVDALHAEFFRRGLKLGLPTTRPWRMRELYVHDPSGNLLKFGQPAHEAP